MMVSIDNCLLPIDVRQAVLTIQKWTVTKPATVFAAYQPSLIHRLSDAASLIRCGVILSIIRLSKFIRIAPSWRLADAMKTLSIASRLEAQHKVMNSVNCTLRNVDYRH